MDVRSEVPEAWAAAAEEVRQHLVSLRGRGLFLSSMDAVQLVLWLEAGVPVARIVLALERAAAARAVKRARTPLQLTHAKRHLGQPAPGAVALPPRGDGPWFQPVADALTEGGPAHRALIAALAAIEVGDPAARFSAAAEAARRFFDARWEELGPDGRAALRRRAAEGLGDLVDAVGPEVVEELVDEGARGLLRAGYPALGAASLWELALAGAADGDE